ncbi:hypothetical protein [Vibrio diabolicus]|uniref:hypothetical protein n=1 Tax=Vibrio diabolicus TaxID=50719 RepID=UPI00375207BA
MAANNQPKPELERREIEAATVNQLFGILSAEYDYDFSEWLDEIVALQQKWEQQGFVEVYHSDKLRGYGRIKESDTEPGTSPYYIGLYHARLLDNGDHDPLVVVKFHETDTGEIVDMKLMLDHDEIFGAFGGQKRKSEEMKAIRKKLDGLVKQADAKLVDKK